MTLATPSVDGARERARRLTWIALVAAIVSLMLIVLGTLFGVRSPWTSWALSLVLMCNAGVFLLPWARQHPRVTAMYYRFASIASLVIFVGIAVRFWHRFRS